MSKFKREERYIVIKLKHLTPAKIDAVRGFLEESDIGTTQCVVVESDWPIYEQVWEMVRRVAEAKKDPDWGSLENFDVECARQLVKNLLDPNMYGFAVNWEIRDSARECFGIPRIEGVAIRKKRRESRGT